MSLYHQCRHTPRGVTCPDGGPHCGATLTYTTEAMEKGRRIHAALEEHYGRKDHDGNGIASNSLYHKLLRKTDKTHEQVQANLQDEREERIRLAAHEATRPKSVLDGRVADHLFIESLIELCEKHNRSICGVGVSFRTLEEGDLDDLRALDPLTRPVPFPEAKRPYR